MKNSLLLILAGVTFVLFLVLGKKKEEAGPPDGTGPAPSPDGYAPDSLVESYIARMRAATTNVELSAVYEEAGEHYGGYLSPHFTDTQYARITAVYQALPWPDEVTPTPVEPASIAPAPVMPIPLYDPTKEEGTGVHYVSPGWTPSPTQTGFNFTIDPMTGVVTPTPEGTLVSSPYAQGEAW